MWKLIHCALLVWVNVGLDFCSPYNAYEGKRKTCVVGCCVFPVLNIAVLFLASVLVCMVVSLFPQIVWCLFWGFLITTNTFTLQAWNVLNMAKVCDRLVGLLWRLDTYANAVLRDKDGV